jgi:hypothetical protein
MIINEQMLIDAEYKCYLRGGGYSFKNADAFYQKLVWLPNAYTGCPTKLYFIDVYFYDNSRFDQPNGAIFEAILYLPNDIGVTVSVSASQFDSITEIEKVFKDLYRNNGFVPNPHNQST